MEKRAQKISKLVKYACPNIRLTLLVILLVLRKNNMEVRDTAFRQNHIMLICNSCVMYSKRQAEVQQRSRTQHLFNFSPPFSFAETTSLK